MILASVLLLRGCASRQAKTSGPWNYNSIYAHVKDKIQAADLAVVNQETVFVENRADISGFPLFGTPTEVGDALADAGFDVVQQASNHTYNKKDQGILIPSVFGRKNIRISQCWAFMEAEKNRK